ncbi:MAG: hypothetical protein ACREEE_13100 [Dongiaceae bacterium]
MSMADDVSLRRDVACLFCGLACDDLVIARNLDGGLKILESRCPLSRPAYESRPAADKARIAGKPTTLDRAVARAADILRAGRLPLFASTVIGLGDRVGHYPGFAMKRGTILARHRPTDLLPGFADCGRLDPGFLRLMLRTLATEMPTLAVGSALGDPLRRLAGDLANDGQGELLFPA